MNRAMFIGRLTYEIELKYIGQSQMACIRNKVAVNRGKDKDGNDKGADFIPVVFFGRQAENLERFSGKGLRVAVEGHIHTDGYTTQSGEKRYTTEVAADRVEFIDWKENSGRNENRGSGSDDLPTGFQAVNDDDIPF